MLWRLAADAVMGLHLGFVVFTAVGVVVAFRSPRIAVVHIPVVLYGVAIEAFGFGCPLTPLEKSLRRNAGAAGYDGGFVEHYVVPVLYPGEWTATTRLSLSALLVASNVIGYLALWRRHRDAAQSVGGAGSRGDAVAPTV